MLHTPDVLRPRLAWDLVGLPLKLPRVKELPRVMVAMASLLTAACATAAAVRGVIGSLPSFVAAPCMQSSNTPTVVTALKASQGSSTVAAAKL